MEDGRADSAAWFDHPMIGTAERYTLSTPTGRFTRVLGKGPRCRLLAALSAAALALQACASPNYPSEEVRASLGRIGLVSAGFTPEVEVPAPFATTEGGAAVGAAAGALAGTAVGAAVLLSALSSCLFAPPACPAVLPFIAGGAAAGGVVGTAVGTADESQSEAGRKAFEPIIDEQVAQDALRARVLAYAAEQGLGPFVVIDEPRPKAPDQPPDYRPLAAKGIDIVLEVSLLSLKLERTALLSDKYRPEAVVRARLVRLDEPAVVRDETYHVWGEGDELGVWARDDRQRFRAWIDHAYETLGRYLVDEFFLLWEPRRDLALYLPGLPTSVGKGLRPEYPGLRESSAFCGAIWFPKCPPYTPALHFFTEIDTLQPTFRWEPFPGAEQQEGEKAPADVREVTYEVKVFSARRSSRTLGGKMVPELLGGPVYSRSGLVEPSHRIEVPLEACTKYFWTVRAKFRLGGQPRLTDWANLSGTPWHTRRAAYSSFSGERQLADPSYYYLPFQTPCPGTASQ